MDMQIALLRGINVGGKNKIAMAQLRELVESLGMSDVQSLLQSGNLVFRSERHRGAELEGLLERETQNSLGVAVDYVVRSADEWATIVARNPFPDEAVSDPSHLVVMCFKTAMIPEKVVELQAAIRGPEQVRGDDRQLYITYPAGIGDSKLTNAVIERIVGGRGTARNWNTALKLAARSLRSA